MLLIKLLTVQPYTLTQINHHHHVMYKMWFNLGFIIFYQFSKSYLLSFHFAYIWKIERVNNSYFAILISNLRVEEKIYGLSSTYFQVQTRWILTTNFFSVTLITLKNQLVDRDLTPSDCLCRVLLRAVCKIYNKMLVEKRFSLGKAGANENTE